MTSNLIKIGLAGLLGLGIAGGLSASVMVNVYGGDDIYQALQAGATAPGATVCQTGGASDAGCAPTPGVAGGFVQSPGTTYAVQFGGIGLALGQGITTVTPISPCVFSVGCPTGGADGVAATPPGTDVNPAAAPPTISTTLSEIQYSGESQVQSSSLVRHSGQPAGRVQSTSHSSSAGQQSRAPSRSRRAGLQGPR